MFSWFASRKLFFIVSTGRTGTKWLSSLLSRCNGKCFVAHEPVPYEAMAYKEAVSDPASADRYIEKFRKKEIYLRIALSTKSIQYYGEVNSILRRHIEPLNKYLADARLLHLVRDGRDFVRSVVSRGTFSGKHPIFFDFRPPIIDEYSAKWFELTEFEKTCWLWQWENKFMRQHIDQTARFEDIVSSYELFEKQILEPLGLDLGETIWKTQVESPKNVSSKYNLGKWDDWTSEQKGQFYKICGKEMTHYGYEI
jgi:hypothetical protein